MAECRQTQWWYVLLLLCYTQSGPAVVEVWNEWCRHKDRAWSMGKQPNAKLEFSGGANKQSGVARTWIPANTPIPLPLILLLVILLHLHAAGEWILCSTQPLCAQTVMEMNLFLALARTVSTMLYARNTSLCIAYNRPCTMLEAFYLSLSLSLSLIYDHSLAVGPAISLIEQILTHFPRDFTLFSHAPASAINIYIHIYSECVHAQSKLIWIALWLELVIYR